MEPLADAASLHPPKTSAVVASELRRRIAMGELSPGDRLPPEDGLMEEFDLARTTLREALRVLESEGLIIVQRGRNGGPRVTSPPVARLAQTFGLHLQLEGTTVDDLVDARCSIEAQLVARLAEHRTDEDLDALDVAIVAAAAAAKDDDPDGFAAAAAGVHATLAERAGNQALAMVAKMIQAVVGELHPSVVPAVDAEMMARVVRSYRRLRRFIEDGDAEAASAHWRRHISFTSADRGRRRQLDLFRY